MRDDIDQVTNWFDIGYFLLVTPCELWRHSQRKLIGQPPGDRDAEENRMDKGKEKLGKTEFGQDAAICPQEEAIFWKSKCAGSM